MNGNNNDNNNNNSNMNVDESEYISSNILSDGISILGSLPNNGTLLSISNDGFGIIKQPVKYNLKHAKTPLNYRDGPNYVQKVENILMSLKQFQKKLPPFEFTEKRKSQVIMCRKKTKASRLEE